MDSNDLYRVVFASWDYARGHQYHQDGSVDHAADVLCRALLAGGQQIQQLEGSAGDARTLSRVLDAMFDAVRGHTYWPNGTEDPGAALIVRALKAGADEARRIAEEESELPPPGSPIR